MGLGLDLRASEVPDRWSYLLLWQILSTLGKSDGLAQSCLDDFGHF